MNSYGGKPTSSTFRGVSYHPLSDKFESRIAVQNVHYFLGLFDDDISAAIVYDAVAVRLGVPSRSNHAYEQYADEKPQVAPSTPTVCHICNGAKSIQTKKLSNGEWIDTEPLPCPLCAN